MCVSPFEGSFFLVFDVVVFFLVLMLPPLDVVVFLLVLLPAPLPVGPLGVITDLAFNTN